MLGGAFAGARTAVGRTPAVSGSLVVRRDAAGMAATVTVDADLRELASDSPRRDQVLRTEGLVTNQFPGASFFADVRIPAGADTGRDFAVDVVGKLTLKGATRDVGVRLTGRLELGRVLVVGNATITLADFGIAPPDVAGVVDVADQGQLEFSLLFVKGA
jgi:polyisoprenoid-binding protein YceI